MNKLLLSILGMASALIANDAVITELSALNIIKENKINILKVQDEGNIYLIHGEPTQSTEGQLKQPFDFFLTKDKKILILGDGIYTDTKAKVTFPVDKNAIKGKEAFSYGSGKEIYYVFLDPECPYCKQFEKKMATLANEYTFKIYLYPLPFHANAIPMSKWILSAKDTHQMGERLIALANGSLEYKELVLTPELSQQLDELIKAQIIIGQEAQINGTPTVLDTNMNKVNWPAL